MSLTTEACSLLARIMGVLAEECADDPPVVPHGRLLVREAQYLAKKAGTASTIAGHIAVRYAGRSFARRVPSGGRKSTSTPTPTPTPTPTLAASRKRKASVMAGGGHHQQRLRKPAPKKTASKKPKKPRRDPKPGSGRGVSVAGGRQKKAGGRRGEDRGAGEGEGTDRERLRREMEKIPYFRDPSFKTAFHMERSTFQALCEVVGFSVAGRTVSPYSKLLGVLWWLAGRESMKQIVRRFDWSLGTFHAALHLFSTAVVEHLMPRAIRWPSRPQEVRACLLAFQRTYNFQGVMGCLGACRLPLRLRSAQRGAPYRPPQGRPSILLQAVCGADRRFLHVSAGWPGSTAQHTAFHQSDLPGLLDKLPDNAQVLASGDYPARNHVWVPFLPGAGLTAEMLYFNRLHAASMVALTGAVRLLKNTFQRLQLLELLPDKVPAVVLAACALLNFILDREEVGDPDRFPVLSGCGFDAPTPTPAATATSTATAGPPPPPLPLSEPQPLPLPLPLSEPLPLPLSEPLGEGAGGKKKKSA